LKHGGFFVNGFTAFGVQPSASWQLNVSPGYSWEGLEIGLRLGLSVVGSRPDTNAGFLLGAEARYMILDGAVKPYPVMSLQGLFGPRNYVLFTLGFGIMYDMDKNLGFFGEISPLGALGGGGAGGDYHFQFGGGVQYRF
jgi:hypothetical protein